MKSLSVHKQEFSISMIDFEEVCSILNKNGYEFLKVIGSGGFSNVFLCHCHKYSEDFAVKRSIKGKLTEWETKTLISLDHPNIIKIYDTFEDKEAIYLVTEYCPNGTIDKKGKLSYEQFILYSKQILSAISYCHSKNISHRDIKPENVFLDQYDNAKLADFGMSRIFENDSKSKERCGSLKFFAPEMFQLKEMCPFKADIWALGITFFIMSTGEYPFQFNTHEELKEYILIGFLNFAKYNVDQRIRFLINKMVQVKPNLRPTADELLNLSIYKQPRMISIKKIPSLLSNMPRKSFPNKVISTSTSMNLKTFQSDSIDENKNEKKQVSLPKLNSFRIINFIPQFQRNCSHYLPLKK